MILSLRMWQYIFYRSANQVTPHWPAAPGYKNSAVNCSVDEFSVVGPPPPTDWLSPHLSLIQRHTFLSTPMSVSRVASPAGPHTRLWKLIMPGYFLTRVHVNITQWERSPSPHAALLFMSLNSINGLLNHWTVVVPMRWRRCDFKGKGF